MSTCLNELLAALQDPLFFVDLLHFRRPGAHFFEEIERGTLTFCFLLVLLLFETVPSFIGMKIDSYFLEEIISKYVINNKSTLKRSKNGTWKRGIRLLMGDDVGCLDFVAAGTQFERPFLGIATGSSCSRSCPLFGGVASFGFIFAEDIRYPPPLPSVPCPSDATHHGGLLVVPIISTTSYTTSSFASYSTAPAFFGCGWMLWLRW